MYTTLEEALEGLADDRSIVKKSGQTYGGTGWDGWVSLNFHIHLSVRRIKSVKDLGICVIEKILILILLYIHTYIYIYTEDVYTYIYIYHWGCFVETSAECSIGRAI